MAEESLQQLFEQHRGKVTDKWGLYLAEYDRILEHCRGDPVRLLEIGVQNGGSLELWARYFPRAERIVGCDIDPRCSRLEFADPRIGVIVGDANADATRAAIRRQSPSFDIVMDDGSHRSGDIVRSFCTYFDLLSERGIYIVEDLHCSYWQEFEGGLFAPNSAMAFFRALTDVVNRSHWGIDGSPGRFLQGFFDGWGVSLDDTSLQQIHSVEFLDSMCVVRKASLQQNRLGHRVIGGELEPVVEGHLDLPADQDLEVPDQSANPYSVGPGGPAERLQALQGRLADLGQHSRQVEQDLAARDAEVNFLRLRVEQLQAAHAEMVAEAKRLHGEAVEYAAGMERLMQAAGERDARFAELEARLLAAESTEQEYKARLINLHQRMEERNTELSHLKQELVAHRALLDYVRDAQTWRWTEPLRRLGYREKFDRAFYLERYPDVAQSGMDPIEHYVAYGRLEGREPKAPVRLGFFARLGMTFRSVLTAEGGISRSLAELFTVLRREGLSGARARVDHAIASEELIGYPEWVRAWDTIGPGNRKRIRRRIEGFSRRPLISVVMPTYNTELDWLRQAVDSVRNQLYPEWELCIADDASTDAGLRDYLEQLARDNDRVKVVFRSENGHISEASNSALGQCSGEWVALLDHDDLLAEHALFCVAEAIDDNPDLKLIYSDEDKFDQDGARFDPYFKTDWNRDLFYSHNMISHLGVYRREILERIGGFRAGFEGSQDYDLALRFIERIDAKDIHHIPRVLYHWRMHSASTASGVEAKPYAIAAGEKALREHFSRTGVAAQVSSLPYGYRVCYALPEEPPLVSLVIPTRNELPLVSSCIESILARTDYPHYEILVVDNGSDDPELLAYLTSLQHNENIRVLRDERPFNFSMLNNSAVQAAKGEVVGFVNNDIEVIAGEWLTEMTGMALQERVGAVGAKLLYPNETVQHAGVVLGVGGVAAHAYKGKPRNSTGFCGRAALISSYSAVTAACMVIRKSVFLEAGGFDEENLPVAFGDVDLCLRVRERGYRNVFNPYALLYHHESASRGTDDTPEKQSRFEAEVGYMKRRWGQALLNDPAYSPNLTLLREDFSLAWPPRIAPPGD